MKLEANLIKLLLCYHVIFVLNDFVLGSISIVSKVELITFKILNNNFNFEFESLMKKIQL